MIIREAKLEFAANVSGASMNQHHVEIDVMKVNLTVSNGLFEYFIVSSYFVFRCMTILIE